MIYWIIIHRICHNHKGWKQSGRKMKHKNHQIQFDSDYSRFEPIIPNPFRFCFWIYQVDFAYTSDATVSVRSIFSILRVHSVTTEEFELAKKNGLRASLSLVRKLSFRYLKTVLPNAILCHQPQKSARCCAPLSPIWLSWKCSVVSVCVKMDVVKVGSYYKAVFMWRI